MRKLEILIPLMSGLISTSAAAQTPTYDYAPAPSGRAMHVLSDKKVVGEAPMPCRPKAIYRYDRMHIVSFCADKPGLLVVSIADPMKPQPIEIWSYDGKLLDVYPVGDKLWMDIKGEGSSPLVLQVETPAEVVPEALAVEIQDPPITPETSETSQTSEVAEAAEVVEATEATEAAEEVPIPTKVGKVLKVHDRDIVVDFGTADGFKKGGVVEFYAIREIQLDGERVTRDDTIAIGKIKSVHENRSVIEVGMNEDVSVGTPARYSTVNYRPEATPPRNGGSDEISMTVRPYLALGALGGGAIMDLSWMHRFEQPMALELSISPIGIAITNQGNAGAFAGHGFFTYDARSFQVGLGVGAARFQAAGLPTEVANGTAVPNTMEFGVSAGQYIRLGSRDGINVTTTTNFVIRNKEWDFGGLELDVQFPMGEFLPDTWLAFRGGGGLPGHTFAEVGLRTMVQGNGNKGSVFVTPTIGYGSITTQEYDDCEFRAGFQCLEQSRYSGPMVGVTVEWRP
jgi:hypothetical protein